MHPSIFSTDPDTLSLAHNIPSTIGKIYWNLDPSELIEKAVARGEGQLTDSGALMVETGTFTGRSPKDRYIVKHPKSAAKIWWGNVNQPLEEADFERIYGRMLNFLSDKDLFVRDAYAGGKKEYGLAIKVINTLAWHNLFCANLFIQPDEQTLNKFQADFTIICAPEFKALPKQEGTRQENFAIIHLEKRILLIGGTGYAGEMKKGIFSVLNYLLPTVHGVLPMHCSANLGKKGDLALFFGLSGTGKTTLSADPNRQLIGDDEHGWDKESVFNFEGGCYAKAIDLTRDKEPEIWDAIRFGSIVENTRFFPESRTVDFNNNDITENTRAAYPLKHIANCVLPSIGPTPKNVFFLTADAFGVIPPISRMDSSQAMYHFVSGYTAKVAGTEMGIIEPKTTFSACFGEAFLPLHPTVYAQLFGEKLEKNEVSVWLVNTGWTGGSYGEGSRMRLGYTRAMITAAIEGNLEEVPYVRHEIFGVLVPQQCPGVPNEILNPRDTWQDQLAYDLKAKELAYEFIQNFEKYERYADERIIAGAPIL